MSFKQHFKQYLEARNALEFFNPPPADKDPMPDVGRIERVGRKEFEFPEDPQKRTLGDLYNRFIQKGGSIIGAGAFGRVLTHPSWDYVLKVFDASDECYLRFIRYAMNNPKIPCLPKVIGKPQRILGNFQRDVTDEYIAFVRLERLYPLTPENEKIVMDNRLRNAFREYAYVKKAGMELSEEEEPEAWHVINKTGEQFPHAESLINVLKELVVDPKYKNCIIDVHDENVMQRENGELVLTDPFSTANSLKPVDAHEKHGQILNHLFRKGYSQLPANTTINKLARKQGIKTSNKAYPRIFGNDADPVVKLAGRMGREGEPPSGSYQKSSSHRVPF